MNKLVFFITALAIALIHGFYAYAGTQLVLDLDDGSLGPLMVRGHFDDEALKAAFGESTAEDMIVPFYNYYEYYCDKGIGFETIISDTILIDVCLKDGSHYNDKIFKAYQGSIKPAIPRNADMNRIKQIFGNPREQTEDALVYDRPYGRLTFSFDSKDGSLYWLTLNGEDEDY